MTSLQWQKTKASCLSLAWPLSPPPGAGFHSPWFWFHRALPVSLWKLDLTLEIYVPGPTPFPGPRSSPNLCLLWTIWLLHEYLLGIPLEIHLANLEVWKSEHSMGQSLIKVGWEPVNKCPPLLCPRHSQCIFRGYQQDQALVAYSGDQLDNVPLY